MSSIDELTKRFNAMSAQRDNDVASRSETEGTGRRVPGGYVTEIVSKSPRSGSSGVETTTKRQVFTEGSDTEGRRTPTIQPFRVSAREPEVRPALRSTNTSSFRSNNGASSDAGYASPRPLPSSSSGPLARSIELSDPSAGRSPLTTPTASFASPPVNPVRSYEPMTVSPAPSTASSIRSVGFGSITTKVVEPSRLSPMRVDKNYAPVKYITKRELRHRQRKGDNLPGSGFSQLRSSSVPRLDETRLSAGRQFDPSGGGRGSPVRRQQQQQQQRALQQQQEQRAASEREQWEHERAIFQNQPPVGLNGDGYAPTSTYAAPSYATSDVGSDAGSVMSPGSGTRAYYSHNQGTIRQDGGRRSLSNGRSSPSRRSAPRRDYDVEFEERQLLEFQPSSPGYPRMVRRSSRPSSVASSDRITPSRSSSMSQPLTRVIRPVDNVTLAEVAAMLGQLRGHREFPAPPPYAEEAFCVVNRGTHLIKYGSDGPHERYLSVRLVQDDRRRLLAPFLVWQKHPQATTIESRYHLSHLATFSRGTHTDNFRRHLIGRDAIEGPHTGGTHRSTLPTTYAFSILFQSQGTARTVDLLALDDQTFRCWQMVIDYLTSVNAGGSGLQCDVESLAGNSVAPSSSY